MVVVNVTFGDEKQVSRQYEVEGVTMRQLQDNLFQLGVPNGVFYKYDHYDGTLTIMDLEDYMGTAFMYRGGPGMQTIQDTVYYGVNNQVLVDTLSLLSAVSRNDLYTVRSSILRGANVNVKNVAERTALSIASGSGYVDVVRELINAGADINGKSLGMTPLHVAVARDRQETVLILINAGANLDETSRGGNTALHEAVRTNNLLMVELLVNAGVSTNIRNRAGLTAEELAIQRGRADIARIIAAGPMSTIKEPGMM